MIDTIIFFASALLTGIIITFTSCFTSLFNEFRVADLGLHRHITLSDGLHNDLRQSSIRLKRAGPSKSAEFTSVQRLEAVLTDNMMRL